MKGEGNMNITLCDSDVERRERKEIKRGKCREGGMVLISHCGDN